MPLYTVAAKGLPNLTIRETAATTNNSSQQQSESSIPSKPDTDGEPLHLSDGDDCEGDVEEVSASICVVHPNLWC